MKINATNTPELGDLGRSFWVGRGGGVFYPTRMFSDRWYLISLDDSTNGYNRDGNGWESITAMWSDIKDQFKMIIPQDTATLVSNDVITLS